MTNQENLPILNILDQFIQSPSTINFEDLTFILYGNFFLLDTPDPDIYYKLKYLLENIFSQKESDLSSSLEQPKTSEFSYINKQIDYDKNYSLQNNCPPPSQNEIFKQPSSISNFFIPERLYK